MQPTMHLIASLGNLRDGRGLQMAGLDLSCNNSTRGIGIAFFGATPALADLLPSVANAESDEMAWLVQNAQELGQHKGEWLLIRGRQLLVHSRDFAAVRAATRELQIPLPFAYYVPTDEESNSVTI
jgi:hypothetical protein